MTHVYAFGSICRGEVAPDSDVDLLALVDGRDDRFSGEQFSIYTYRRIEKLWREGNAFAWHLALERALIFSSDGKDFLASLGMPASYSFAERDSDRLVRIFRDALDCVASPESRSIVFEFGSIYLAIRNLATCYSLVNSAEPVFSRDAPLLLDDRSLDVPPSVYSTLLRCRILSTRGKGKMVSEEELNQVLCELDNLENWVNKISEAVKNVR